MKKIKILRIIARLNIGGPAIHAVLLTEGLDKAKFDSLLICGSISQNEGDMFYYASEKDVRPVFIPELKREISFLNDILAFKKIYNIIITEQPDIIHTHTAKAGTLGRLAGIVYNFLNPHKQIKIIHTFHGHIFEGYFNKFKTTIFIFIEQFLAIFTHRIITVSESIKKELISLGVGDKDKIAVIPLGFELEEFLTIPPRDSVVINIGIVGRLVPIKNHRLFLEAASKVIADNSHMPLKFKIIGDGQLRGGLEEYACRLNISQYVDFLGWQKDIAGVYADLDIVALTSINEGTPVSLIEAMACGRAIVATDVGGGRDLLGTDMPDYIKTNTGFRVLERGVIVRPGDCNSFAAALGFIVQNGNLRQKIGKGSREFVINMFSKERLIKDVEDLYHDLLSHNKSA